MALQFNPPDWLIQEYMNRKSPQEDLLNTSLNAANSYVQYKNQKQQRKNEAIATLAKLYDVGGPDLLNKVGAPIAKDSGVDLSGFQTPKPATNINLGLTAGTVNPQTNEPVTSSIIDEWNNKKPDIYGANPEELLNQGTHGMKELDKRLALQKYQDSLGSAEQKEIDKAPLSIEQYSALSSGDPDSLAKAFPSGIPRSIAGQALLAPSRNVRVMNDPYGNPIRVPVGGGNATPVNVPKDNLSPLQKKLNPMEYKDWQKEVSDFDNDSVVKADRAILANLNQIQTEIAKFNPSLTGPLRSQQARAIAREVGALSDSDLARQALDPSVLGRLKSFISIAATGEIPKDQLDLLKQTVGTISQSASNRILTVAKERASRKSNLYGGKVSPDELIGSLQLPTSFSVNAPAQSTGSNEIVRQTKDGKKAVFDSTTKQFLRYAE